MLVIKTNLGFRSNKIKSIKIGWNLIFRFPVQFHCGYHTGANTSTRINILSSRNTALINKHATASVNLKILQQRSIDFALHKDNICMLID